MNQRRVLVTGASRGIGKATAIALAKDGFAVTVHYHSNKVAAEEVLETIRTADGIADAIQFDISDREQTKMTLETDIETNGAFYGVVCNAGIADDAAFPAMEAEQWDSVIRTNLDGFYNVLYPLVMPMVRLRQGGRIVTLTSVSGLIGNRGQTNYSAAKAGIIGATKSLAVELAKRKITVNSVAPGVIETDMTEDLFNEEMYVKEAKKMIPMGRFGQAEDISSMISFLFSDKASYVTRQVISVNGGMC